jgi:hypothetical protein
MEEASDGCAFLAWHPKIARAGIKDDLESLRRCSQGNVSEVLRVGKVSQWNTVTTVLDDVLLVLSPVKRLIMFGGDLPTQASRSSKWQLSTILLGEICRAGNATFLRQCGLDLLQLHAMHGGIDGEGEDSSRYE